MPLNGDTFYAKWTAITYTITFDSNSGSSVSSVTGSSGTQISTAPATTRSGYIFNGWYYSETSNNGSGTLVSFPFTITANDTLYAKWTARPTGLVTLGSVGAQNSATWTQRTFTIPNYVGAEDVRLVVRYQSGTSYTGDAQLDDFNIGGNTYDPNSGTLSFQRNSDAGSTNSNYDNVTWENLADGTTAGKWNRDASGTPSGSTGNTSGNTGAYYFYAETSSPGFSNKYFWLRSPEVTITSGAVTLYTAQNGATCGSFVFYLDFGGTTAVQTAKPNIQDYGCYTSGLYKYVT